MVIQCHFCSIVVVAFSETVYRTHHIYYDQYYDQSTSASNLPIIYVWWNLHCTRRHFLIHIFISSRIISNFRILSYFVLFPSLEQNNVKLINENVICEQGFVWYATRVALSYDRKFVLCYEADEELKNIVTRVSS